MKYPDSPPIIWIIDGLGYGGAEQLMVPILEKLSAVFPLRVCALQVKDGNPIAGQLKTLSIPVDQLDIPNLRSLSNLPKLLRYLRAHSPALLHTQLQFSDILGSVAGKLLGIPTISTQHTLEFISEPSTAKMRQSLTWFCLRYISNQLITVSKQTETYHIQHGKINPQKITTIHNGINIKKFSNPPQDAAHTIRSKHNIPENAKLILTVAVLREQKGIQYLISAMPQIIKTQPDTYYLIVGDGDYHQTLAELAKKENVSERIIFAGHQTNVPEYLAACDLFILPTLIDAFPTVLLEAMAAKKPIIASNVGGVPEIIDDGLSGILVEPANTSQLIENIQLLFSNPQKTYALANSGYQAVLKNFSVENQVNQLEKIYLNLINE